MIQGVSETAKDTITLIRAIKELMLKLKHQLRANYKFYSQDLLNNIFKHPYTKIDFVSMDLKVTRRTAASYLNQLSKDGFLHKEKYGNTNYYINERLFDLLNGL